MSWNYPDTYSSVSIKGHIWLNELLWFCFWILQSCDSFWRFLLPHIPWGLTFSFTRFIIFLDFHCFWWGDFTLNYHRLRLLISSFWFVTWYENCWSLRYVSFSFNSNFTFLLEFHLALCRKVLKFRFESFGTFPYDWILFVIHCFS